MRAPSHDYLIAIEAYFKEASSEVLEQVAEMTFKRWSQKTNLSYKKGTEDTVKQIINDAKLYGTSTIKTEKDDLRKRIVGAAESARQDATFWHNFILNIGLKLDSRRMTLKELIQQEKGRR